LPDQAHGSVYNAQEDEISSIFAVGFASFGPIWLRIILESIGCSSGIPVQQIEYTFTGKNHLLKPDQEHQPISLQSFYHDYGLENCNKEPEIDENFCKGCCCNG